MIAAETLLALLPPQPPPRRGSLSAYELIPHITMPPSFWKAWEDKTTEDTKAHLECMLAGAISPR